MAQPTTKIPLFYRILFIWIDPLMAAWAAYACFASPDLLLNSYVPSSISVRNPMHDMLFHQIGGGFVNVVISQVFLLSYTNDVNIWKIVHAGLLGADIAIAYGFFNAVSTQGRLDPAVWRMEDWVTIGNTILIGLSRAAVVVGLGMGNGKNQKTD
jgi:hypothetical protein